MNAYSQAYIEEIINQRNAAFNRCADLSGKIAELEAELQKVRAAVEINRSEIDS